MVAADTIVWNIFRPGVSMPLRVGRAARTDARETSMETESMSDQATRRQALAGMAAAVGALALGARSAAAAAGGRAGGDEISRDQEAIHHEVVFKANRKRVFELLTETKEFDKVVQASGVMKSGAPLGNAPTSVSKEAGGAFTAFGGHITGRQIELVANERLVQAWRAASWEAGAYSIARFTLVEQGGATRLVFDHVGFPKGEADHLAAGWKAHYWEPMAKVIG